MNANHLDLKYIEHCTDAFCNTVESLKSGHHWRKTALRKSDREAKQSVPRYTVRLMEVSALLCVRYN